MCFLHLPVTVLPLVCHVLCSYSYSYGDDNKDHHNEDYLSVEDTHDDDYFEDEDDEEERGGDLPPPEEDPCLRACPFILLPVCAVNSYGKPKTFPNTCVLESYNACNKTDYVAVANCTCSVDTPETTTMEPVTVTTEEPETTTMEPAAITTPEPETTTMEPETVTTP